MSGFLGDYSAEQLRAMGAAHIFEKPFRLAELASTLEKLVGSRVQ